MSTTDVFRENAVYAAPVSKDGLVHFYSDSFATLARLGLDKEEQIRVTFGIKKWSVFSRGAGHRALIVKLTEMDKCAFKLELDIHTPSGEKENYIHGMFSCPKQDCRFRDRPFSELADHHLTQHRKYGDEFAHTCCGAEFTIFETLCQHVYDRHRNLASIVGLNFEPIREEGYSKFLNPEHVQFYDNFEKTMTMKEILHLAGQIILDFHRYWIFMWNCQDFAAWYLHTLGIPLEILDPTIPDKITGSGTKSSARKVQSFKGWAFYKQPEQLRKLGLNALGGDVTCNHCKYMPPLSFEAMNFHAAHAHAKSEVVAESESKTI